MQFLLYLLQIPSALMILYLDILSVAALFWRNAPPAVSPSRRFAILVPAHNEQLFLPRLLRSLKAVNYPSGLYDVYVVADNCTDGTALAATAAGVHVYERCNDRLLGKGYALAELIGHVRQSARKYDAYVIVDADSTVSANLLDVISRHLNRGDKVVQCYYGVANQQDSWTSELRAVSLALFNGLRPRGRDALGLSAGLHGNGMCFSADTIDRCGWNAFTLAEDVELHLALVEQGIRTRYAAEAGVYGEMPTSLRQAQSQNVRWERGRLQMLQRFGPHLLKGARHKHDLVRIDAIAEQAIPPLSVLTAVNFAFFLLTSVTRYRGPWKLSSIVLLGQTVYIAAGLHSMHASFSTYLALLTVPRYLFWKLWIYCLAAIHLDDSKWIRTDREQSVRTTK